MLTTKKSRMVEIVKTLLDSFYGYCSKEGLNLLNDDKKFIKDNISLFHNISDARKILNLYRFEWIAGMNNEENEIKKENAGRYRANKFLLNISKIVSGMRPESINVEMLLKK